MLWNESDEITLLHSFVGFAQRARDRRGPHQGVGCIRAAHSSRARVLSPLAGRSILEAMPPLFGPWSLIHTFQPTMRSLGARSSLCSSLISSRLMLQSSSVRACNSSTREFPCLTLGNGKIPEQMVNEGLESGPDERYFLRSHTILLQSKNMTSKYIKYDEYAEYAE